MPQALATAAILAMTGRLWITKDTSFFWCLARVCACPRSPNPVTSVAPWALYLCMRRAAVNRKTYNLMNSKVVNLLNSLSYKIIRSIALFSFLVFIRHTLKFQSINLHIVCFFPLLIKKEQNFTVPFSNFIGGRCSPLFTPVP